MELLIQWLCEHQENAHLIVFGLLMLAGFSLPISEDLMLVASGVIASTVLPERTIHLFIAVFLGCYFSDWIAYGMGRFFGKKALSSKWFSSPKAQRRFRKLQSYYERYGFLTLFVGRFIPFGLRNGIFMTAGVGKMHFGKFIVGDGIACLIFSALVFFIAYSCGKNYEALTIYMHQTSIVLFVLVLLSVCTSIGYYIFKKRSKALVEPLPSQNIETTPL